jgi:hypothetical protein
MRSTGRYFGRPLAALLLLALGAGAGRAEYLTSGPGLEGLGNYTGKFEYVASGPATATLTVVLTNTSPSGNGGYLTAFAFRNPSGQITGATLVSSNPNFALFGDPKSPGGIAAPPFGNYDLGASTTGSFLGGGSPKGGIGVGQTATFTFALTGQHLDQLSATSFFSLVPGTGAHWADFLARFRGVKKGSDKVPGLLGGSGPPAKGVLSVPEPGTLTLAGIAAGVLGVRLVRWRGRRGD